MTENSGHTLRLVVVTPAGVAWEKEAAYVVLQTSEGQIEVLPGHAALVVTLEPGELRIGYEGREEIFAAGDGFTEVLPDRVTVFAHLAERADEIAIDATEAARLRAEQALAGAAQLSDDERLEAESLLEECDVKIRIAFARKHLRAGSPPR